MSKGFFSQCVCFLTDGTTVITDIKSVLRNDKFEIVAERQPQKNWQFGGPALAVAFLPKVNGYAMVDVVEQTWPDEMGDPKSDPETFSAWALAQFGEIQSALQSLS